MKYIYIIFYLATLVCSAQTPVKSLADDTDLISGAYYKDINNDFNEFVGTWQLNANNINFTIKLEKRNMQQVTHSESMVVYEDFLVGGYNYAMNNIELVNTMAQLSSSISNPFDYHLYSMAILKNNGRPKCNECQVDERRVAISFEDPSRTINGLNGILILRRINENGVSKLKAKLIRDGKPTVINGQEPQYTEFTVPFGEYTLTKID